MRAADDHVDNFSLDVHQASAFEAADELAGDVGVFHHLGCKVVQHLERARLRIRYLGGGVRLDELNPAAGLYAADEPMKDLVNLGIFEDGKYEPLMDEIKCVLPR